MASSGHSRVGEWPLVLFPDNLRTAGEAHSHRVWPAVPQTTGSSPRPSHRPPERPRPARHRHESRLSPAPTIRQHAPVPADRDRPVIDVTLVRRLIARQFPQWAGLDVRPVAVDGWDNRTFHLGDELSVRLPSAEGYALAVAKEQRCLPALAPQLPLPIPAPVANGAADPEAGYPFAWTVNRWLPGDTVLHAGVCDQDRFAEDVAAFLVALRAADTTDAPLAGAHSAFRGVSPAHYDDETRAALDALDGQVDRRKAEAVWDEALSTDWASPAVWFHGDVAVGNLLVRDDRLCAVIDFGTSGVGDPACDCVLAWTYLREPARQRFRQALGLDDATWARGRGWALWKALISHDSSGSRATLSEVFADAV